MKTTIVSKFAFCVLMIGVAGSVLEAKQELAQEKSTPQFDQKVIEEMRDVWQGNKTETQGYLSKLPNTNAEEILRAASFADRISFHFPVGQTGYVDFSGKLSTIKYEIIRAGIVESKPAMTIEYVLSEDSDDKGEIDLQLLEADICKFAMKEKRTGKARTMVFRRNRKRDLQSEWNVEQAIARVNLSQVKIVFLANEGFLIQNREKSILIDAFIRDAHYGYGALPPAQYKDLIGANQPFSNIGLALTTHVHLDHFQAESAVEFLENHPNCKLVSTEQVALKIREAKTQLHKQMVSVWPEKAQVKSLKVDAIKLDTFRLRHANPRNYDIQNLGFVVHVGGKKILHVGDAEAKAVNFEALKLNELNIDVAILPYWMFRHQKLVDEQIAAKQYIAAHIPVDQFEAINQELPKSGRDLRAFNTPLSSMIVD